MYVRDLEGNEFSVQATTTKDNEMNGNQSLTGTIEYTKVNAHFLHEIDRLWEIYDHDDVGYKIITLNKQGKGNKLFASFTAVPLFLDYMDTHSMMDDNGDHYRYDGSLTAYNAAKKIFDDTPFDFVIVDEFTAKEWENFGGGESKLESLKRWLERYRGEFRLVGSTVYLEHQIGRDASIQYRHRFNASNIKQEIDASKQYTAIKGYGNYGNGTGEDESEEDYRDAKLKREYVSPLSKVLGKRYSPPFMDGRVKIKSEMDRKLKEEVDNSLKVSVSANIYNLSKQGYPIDNSQAGDRVFLIDPRIGFDEEVRVVSQSITRNWRGKVIDAKINFGNEGLGKRHQSKLNTAVDNITDIFEGRKELPLSHLDKRVQEISNIINGNTDSIFKYTPNGIIGWNGDDPNYMTRYVGDAIGFSTDGGKTYGTAMSADLGIVADYITTGTLRAIIVDGVEIYGSYIEGSEIVSKKNDDNYIQIKGPEILSYGRHSREWIGDSGKDDVRIGFENGQLRARNNTEDWSLYLNDRGLTTFADGDGDGYPGGNASGIIEFHSYRYSDGDFRGMTLMSYGRIGIESSNEDGARIYLNPNGASVRVSDVNDKYYNIAVKGVVTPSSKTSEIGARSSLLSRPNPNEASKLISDLPIMRLTEKGNPVFDLTGRTALSSDEEDGKDLNKAVMYLLKSQQETIDRVTKLEEVV